MKRRAIIIGARGSRLAVWQAEHIKSLLLERRPEASIEIKTMRSAGDEGSSIKAAPQPGVFTRRIEDALLAGEVDIAVHSLKDLPVETRDGLELSAIPQRENPADALIAKDGLSFIELPSAAKLLTGSPRRRALALNRRPDLNIEPVRGNVPTRLEKMDQMGADAMILAFAGLKRLGLDGRISEILPPEDFQPAPGQGALGVQTRSDDIETRDICAVIDHRPSRLAVTAERAFLHAIGAGCHLPAGAIGVFDETSKSMRLVAMVASSEGERLIRHESTRKNECDHDAEELGRQVARGLIDKGAAPLLTPE